MSKINCINWIMLIYFCLCNEVSYLKFKGMDITGTNAFISTNFGNKITVFYVKANSKKIVKRNKKIKEKPLPNYYG